MATLLEHLPDEVLLIICQYLSREQIILAFFDLNYRLNCTISQFIQSLLISDDKYEQGKLSRRLLSIIGPHLQSLTVQNTRLSSAKISLASNVQELTIINAQLDAIPVLNNLTDLNIIYGSLSQSLDLLFSNWNNLHSVFIASTSPLIIPISSSSSYTFSKIKQLAITLQSPKDAIRLLGLCPELTCLNLNLQSCTLDEPISIEPPSSLRMFSLRTTHEINVKFEELKTLLKYITPQLEHLSLEIETDDIACLDGRLWENYLKENFRELNLLEFFLLVRNEGQDQSKPLRLPDVLKTFQSVYWPSIVPQNFTGYYNRFDAHQSICVHTDTIPTVKRRRYFLY